jgi:hypothetical protein
VEPPHTRDRHHLLIASPGDLDSGSQCRSTVRLMSMFGEVGTQRLRRRGVGSDAYPRVAGDLPLRHKLLYLVHGFRNDDVRSRLVLGDTLGRQSFTHIPVKAPTICV